MTRRMGGGDVILSSGTAQFVAATASRDHEPLFVAPKPEHSLEPWPGPLGSRHAPKQRWYFWATHSRLKPIIEAAKALKRHEAGLLSYFAHRITNAGAEGLSSRIQARFRVAAWGLPQPGALQDRDLVPSRWIAALPDHTVTHGLPGRAY